MCNCVLAVKIWQTQIFVLQESKDPAQDLMLSALDATLCKWPNTGVKPVHPIEWIFMTSPSLFLCASQDHHHHFWFALHKCKPALNPRLRALAMWSLVSFQIAAGFNVLRSSTVDDVLLCVRRWATRTSTSASLALLVTSSSHTSSSKHYPVWSSIVHAYMYKIKMTFISVIHH